MVAGFVLQFAVGDQQLVFAGILGELEHFDVEAELDLGGLPPPAEVAGWAALQAPDGLLRGDGCKMGRRQRMAWVSAYLSFGDNG